MIPGHLLQQRAVGHLMEYLKDEISRALSERRPLEEKWLKHQRTYKTIPLVQTKEFPFLGAANLVLPVGAIDTDTIYSRLMGILFGPENLWSCRALREDAVEFAPRLQEFLRWAQNAELGAYGASADWLLELCKLGTGVLKQRYRREQRLTYEFRETPGGPMQRFARTMVKDHPVIEHVSLYDFLVPAGTTDHQLAPWNSERLLLSWPQIEQRVRAGIYTGTDRLQAWASQDQGSWLQHELAEMQMFTPGRPNKVELWESWVDFDVTGFGEPMPLVCTIHLPSMTYLRIDWNPFFHQERPFEVARYLRQEKQFYGIGVMELQEMIGDETTTMHNQRIDNATLANSVMMKGRKGIGLKDDEPLFPGRWFLLENMDDVQTLQFGRPFDATLQNEEMLLGYGARRTGVNDYVMGNASPSVGYGTAQTSILQHTEAAKRFDQTLREVRTGLGGAGRRCVELYQQFDSRGKEYQVLGEADGAVVHQILQMPTELIRHAVAIEVTATSASLNKEVQIRTNTIMMQLVSQFYEQAFMGMQMVVNPQMPPQLRALAQHMVMGGATMMKRLLDSYDMQDISRIIPDMQELVSGQAQQYAELGMGGGQAWADPVGTPAAPGGAGALAGLLQSPGMGGI